MNWQNTASCFAARWWTFRRAPTIAVMFESDGSSPGRDEEVLEAGVVPLFPLVGGILLPGAVMPLHIFESRYRQMVGDALAGDQRLAMAVLEDGHDEEYLQSPPIGRTVCVGRIITHELLADGRYNLLLLGLFRAHVVREVVGEGEPKPYRLAEYVQVQEPPVMEIDLANDRQRLLSLFSEPVFESIPVGRKLRELVRSSRGTAEVADVVGYHLVMDAGARRRLLEETDRRRRVSKVVSAVADVLPRLKSPPAE